MTTKDELLSAAAREFDALRAALAGLSEAQMQEVWLGVWSVKDILAHMAGWHREMIPALERLARGERPGLEGVSYDDVDAWNARFVAERREWTPTETQAEVERSHAAFLRAAQAVPAERYQPGKTAWRIVDLNSVHHYKEHGDQIRAWRAARGI